MFKLEKRLQKSGTSHGISMALAKLHFPPLGGDILCYSSSEISVLQQEHTTLNIFPLKVLFGIQIPKREYGGN